MRRLAKHRPSPAMIVALIALFVSLGGAAFAAGILPKNSVGSKQLKKNSVTSVKVKDASLKAADFAAGQLPAGAKGATGATGPKGATGEVTPGTFLGGKVTAQFEAAAADLANGANQSYAVFCPAGQIATGGGGRGDDTLSEETILTNTRPAISASNTEPPTDGQSFTGWRITIVNPAGGAASGIKPEVWVICAALP